MSIAEYHYAPHDFMISYMIRHPEVTIIEDKYSSAKRMKTPVRFRIEDYSASNYFVDNPTYIIGASNNKLYQVTVYSDPAQGIQKKDITNKHNYKWHNHDGDDLSVVKASNDYENSLEYSLDRIMYNLKSSGLQRHLLPTTDTAIKIAENKVIFTGRNSNSHTREMDIIDFEIVLDEESITVVLLPHEDQTNGKIIIDDYDQEVDQNNKKFLKHIKDDDSEKDYEDIAKWIIENMQKIERMSRRS